MVGLSRLTLPTKVCSVAARGVLGAGDVRLVTRDLSLRGAMRLSPALTRPERSFMPECDIFVMVSAEKAVS